MHYNYLLIKKVSANSGSLFILAVDITNTSNLRQIKLFVQINYSITEYKPKLIQKVTKLKKFIRLAAGKTR